MGRLTEILLQRRDLDKRALRLLERELKKHPWSQPLRMMYAKALKKLEKPGFEEAVNKAAAGAPDPVAFRDILNDRRSINRSSAGQGKKSNDSSQQEGQLSQHENTAHREVQPADPAGPSHLEGNPDQPGDSLQQEDKQSRPDKQDNKPQPGYRQAEADKEVADDAAVHATKPQRDLAAQLAIIDRFLENEPRISAPRDDTPEGELAPESLDEPEDMISETLADVLVKQGKIARAIDIFQKLSLKFPEKSSYFAKKIESVLEENNKTE